MDLKGKRLLLVGGAGLIGSHTADALLGEEVAEVRIFDNFSRGHEDNLVEVRRDPRLTIFMGGSDLLPGRARGCDGRHRRRARQASNGRRRVEARSMWCRLPCGRRGAAPQE